MFLPLFKNCIHTCQQRPQPQSLSQWKYVSSEGQILAFISSNSVINKFISQSLHSIKDNVDLNDSKAIQQVVYKSLEDLAEQVFAQIPFEDAENIPKPYKSRLVQFIRLEILAIRLFDDNHFFQLCVHSFQSIPNRQQNLRLGNCQFRPNVFSRSYKLARQIIRSKTLRQTFELFKLLRETILFENRLNLKFHKVRKGGIGVDDLIEALKCMLEGQDQVQHIQLSQFLEWIIREFQRESKYEVIMPIIRCYTFYLYQP